MTLQAVNIGYTWRFRGGEQVALRDFSADFPTGTVHVICGPSGSGKSTLGFLLAGILPPDTGRISFDGEEVAQRREEIAYVFQFPESIFFEDSMEEEVRQLKSARGALNMSWFKRLGVPFAEIAGVHPFHLSAGYGRLAAVAMQLARTPRLLILDEPTIGLDWLFHRRMMDALKLWIAPDRTLVVITHDLDIMRELGGHAWVLNAGDLAWNGTPSDLLSHEDLLERFGLIAR